MKKTLLGLAFIAVASLSFPVTAQNKMDNACKSTECIAKNKKCCKDGKKNCLNKCAKANLFEGIQLTTEQKGRIEALDNAVKVSRQEIRTQAKNARDKKDTTYNPRNAQKELRNKYINDLGEILSSDQMIVYLKNFYVNNPSHHGGKKALAMKKGKRHHDGKGNQDGKAMKQAKVASSK